MKREVRWRAGGKYENSQRNVTHIAPLGMGWVNRSRPKRSKKQGILMTKPAV